MENILQHLKRLIFKDVEISFHPLKQKSASFAEPKL